MSTKLSYSGKGLIFRNLKYPENFNLKANNFPLYHIRHVGLCPNAQTQHV